MISMENFDRSKMEDLVKRRFFYDASFAIYGGISGLYDMGPMGCAMKSNILSLWRNHFILKEQMLEVDCSILTPEPVLKASGHVDRFSDYMVKDVITQDCFRVDHLIKGHIEKLLKNSPPMTAKTPLENGITNSEINGDSSAINALGDKLQNGLNINDNNNNKDVNTSTKSKSKTPQQNPKKVVQDAQLKPLSHAERAEFEAILHTLDDCTPEGFNALIRRFDIRSPITGNELSEPLPFNLMFETHIGPSGLVKGFLRPETAQGIFVNFKRLLEFNQGKLPFAAAQIGNSFRNEISPRSGLLRVREFTMAEIEHFVDPSDKSHPKFVEVADLKLKLYSAQAQCNGETPRIWTLKDAVEQKLIDNETLAYYMARIYLFLLSVGIREDCVRFRQHMSNEMAHYACDCWDAECLTSYGWIECVGCADRSCYDLKQHTKATGVKLCAEKILPKPVIRNVTEIVIKKEFLGPVFKKDSRDVLEYFALLDDEVIKNHVNDLETQGFVEIHLSQGKHYTIKQEMVNVKNYDKTIHVEEVIPSVIEPSFGIGRIMYSVLEHSFRIRDKDEKRTYFALPASVAPYKCALLPLSNNQVFTPILEILSKQLTDLGVSHRENSSGGSIGRRYARMDEIAIPFAITVDFDSVVASTPYSVTLRERDTMTQIRGNVDEITQLVADLCDNKIKWDDVLTLYPMFTQQESTKGE